MIASRLSTRALALCAVAVWSCKHSRKPDAPTNVVATITAPGVVAVSWTPGADGLIRLTGYTLTSSPAGVSLKTDQTSVSVQPPIDQTYTFSVHETNARGDSPESEPSNAVTVLGLPDPGKSTLTATDTVADGNTASEITVTIADPGGVPLKGETVVLTHVRAWDRFWPTRGVTDAHGQFKARLTAMHPGLRKIHAQSGSISMDVQLTVAPPPCHGTFSFGAPVSIRFDNTQAPPITADFDRNGYLDIILGETDVGVLLGPGYMSGGGYDGSAGSVDAFDVGDWNNDGNFDIAAAVNDQHHPLMFLSGNGDGTFGPPVQGGAGEMFMVLGGDFDQDGNPDLIENINVGVHFLQGNGDGTFRFAGADSIEWIDSRTIVDDVNLDGKPDLVAPLNDTVDVMLGNGDGTFKPAIVTSYSGGVLNMGDFVRDGRPDMLFSTGRKIAVLPGNGDGTFGAPITTDVPTTITYDLTSVVSADFDGDGELDVVAGSRFDILYWRGHGDGTFDAPVDVEFDRSPGFTVGDFNRDGIVDLLAIAHYPPSGEGQSQLFPGHCQ